MKAYYKTVLKGEGANPQHLNESADQVYEYKLLGMSEYCCQEMKEALADDAIGFGEFHDTILNGDCNINFSDCRPYPEGEVWDYYPIRFCPFCGRKVETEERERVSRKKVRKFIPARTENAYEEITVD